MTENLPPDGGGNINNLSNINSESDKNNSEMEPQVIENTISMSVNNHTSSIEDERRSIQTATGDNTQKPKTFNINKSYLYSDNVYVFIEKLNTDNIGRLHPMAVGHILHQKLKISNIKRIQKVGKNRVRVQLETLKDANNLINNKELNNENLKAFIPNNLLERKGVIKEVDTIFNEEYLLKNIITTSTVTEVRRFKKNRHRRRDYLYTKTNNPSNFRG